MANFHDVLAKGIKCTHVCLLLWDFIGYICKEKLICLMDKLISFLFGKLVNKAIGFGYKH